MRALSIRQPWAWAIVAGHKGIENRTWQTNYRGPLLIHAGRLPASAADLDRLKVHARRNRFALPDAEDLLLGGIVGRVDLVGIVAVSSDPWFKGPYGWVLDNRRAVRFCGCPGRLRLFAVATPDRA